ncbi:MAG TPA: aminoglycoside phosphotransferase family protein [Acidimicrobiia bacterium]|jgi:hypothetical protein
MAGSPTGGRITAMAVSNPRTARLRDPALPAVEDLLDGVVPASLQVALAAQGIRVLRAEAVQVTWWPGESITVRYDADLTGSLEGSRQVVAVSGRIPDGATIVETDVARVGVWVVPHDPALPGLAAATDEPTLRRLLDDLGVPSNDQPVPRLRAYRPGRRAVVEVSGGASSVFLKLVPPGEVRALHQTHGALAEDLPVPRSLGYDEGLGLLAMQALPGVTLRRALEIPTEPLPAPGLIDRLLDSLPAAAATSPTRSAADRLERITRLLRRLVPEEEGSLEELANAIGPELDARSVPVHGDLYEGQILVMSGTVSGLLDVETFGMGRAGEDQAAMIGHLSLWQQISAQPERTRRLGNRFLAAWDRRLDPVDLRRRAAAVILSLATGPFRVQRPAWPEETKRRIRLAESWMASARLAGERSLTAGSSPSHGRGGF